MLTQNKGLMFLNSNFTRIWKVFHSLKESEIYDNLKNEIKEHFLDVVFKTKTNFLELLITNTNEIGSYELVKIWLLLETLNAEEVLNLNSKYSVACFWEYPNVFNSQSPINYEIGNLLLGTSYYNNKTGDLKYELPLMKVVKNSNELEIEQQTKKYISLLENEFGNIF